MLRLEEFGSVGCVKEAHGGGHAEIRKSPQLGKELSFLILQRTVSGDRALGSIAEE